MIIPTSSIGFMQIVRKSGWCVGLTLLILLLTLNHTAATEISGRVVGITDGDTLTVLMDRKQIKVRLAEIDTPESRQPYGSRARRGGSDQGNTPDAESLGQRGFGAFQCNLEPVIFEPRCSAAV